MHVIAKQLRAEVLHSSLKQANREAARQGEEILKDQVISMPKRGQRIPNLALHLYESTLAR